VFKAGVQKWRRSDFVWLLPGSNVLVIVLTYVNSTRCNFDLTFRPANRNFDLRAQYSHAHIHTHTKLQSRSHLKNSQFNIIYIFIYILEKIFKVTLQHPTCFQLCAILHQQHLNQTHNSYYSLVHHRQLGRRSISIWLICDRSYGKLKMTMRTQCVHIVIFSLPYDRSQINQINIDRLRCLWVHTHKQYTNPQMHMHVYTTTLQFSSYSSGS
jgi:hypothetical protein